MAKNYNAKNDNTKRLIKSHTGAKTLIKNKKVDTNNITSLIYNRS